MTRLRVSRLHAVHDGDPVQFSLDGEVLEATELSAACRPGAVRFHVGDGYETDPRDPLRSVRTVGEDA